MHLYRVNERKQFPFTTELASSFSSLAQHLFKKNYMIIEKRIKFDRDGQPIIDTMQWAAGNGQTISQPETDK